MTENGSMDAPSLSPSARIRDRRRARAAREEPTTTGEVARLQAVLQRADCGAVRFERETRVHRALSTALIDDEDGP